MQVATDEKRIQRTFFAQCLAIALPSFYFEAIFSLNTQIIWKLFMIKRKLQLLNLTTVRLLLLLAFSANISLSRSRTSIKRCKIAFENPSDIAWGLFRFKGWINVSESWWCSQLVHKNRSYYVCNKRIQFWYLNFLSWCFTCIKSTTDILINYLVACLIALTLNDIPARQFKYFKMLCHSQRDPTTAAGIFMLIAF